MDIANVTNGFVSSGFPCSSGVLLASFCTPEAFRRPHFCGCGLFPTTSRRGHEGHFSDWLHLSTLIIQSSLPESWGCWSTPVINSRHGRLTTADLGVNKPQKPGREWILGFPLDSATVTLPCFPRWPDSDVPRSVLKCPFSSLCYPSPGFWDTITDVAFLGSSVKSWWTPPRSYNRTRYRS